MSDVWEFCSTMLLIAFVSLVCGFLFGAFVMYDDKIPTREEMQEQIDTLQMKQDLLIEMLKATPRGEMNWDKL